MKTQLILSLCTLLAACSGGQPQGNAGKYKPVVNPHPQYFVTVSGHIDPQFAKAVHLSWQTTAWTKNPKCQVTINKFEGVVDERYQEQVYPVKVDKQGYYHINIPIDHYLPGYCDWRMRLISFTVADLKNVLIAGFAEKQQIPFNHTVTNKIYCHQSSLGSYKCRFKNRIKVFNGTNFNVPFDQKYYFKLLIVKEKDSNVKNN